MIERWSRDQVLALAPDASSKKGAQSVSGPGKWPVTGVMPDVLWGECKGSGATPYRACVDLADTAYRCSCPSRKFPCKHTLGLLLLWSADGVSPADEPPAWVREWLEQRRARAARTAPPPPPSPDDPPGPGSRSAAGEAADGTGGPDATGAGPEGSGAGGSAGADGSGAGDGARPGGADAGGAAGPGGAGADAAARRAAQREERVTAGLAELERWLADQIGQGLASARRDAPAQWQELARRLVDAQAPGVAGFVSRLPRVLADEDWPSRLLGEYGLLNLLAVGHRRAAVLPGPLRDTIRSRVGFPVSREDVLAGERVRDEWDVLGRRDDEQDHLVSRRVWLRGRRTGRFALVLSFAPPGQPLDASLVTGTAVDADLAFYPGATPLRALVATRHAPVPAAPPEGTTVAGALTEIAGALTGDPWTDSWPVVLRAATPARTDGLWLLTDPGPEAAGEAGGDPAAPGSTGSATPGTDGNAPGPPGLLVHPVAGHPWRLLAVSGGRPVTVAGEWTPRGIRPFTAWDEQGRMVVL
ncbi:SWIM zinc finger family protein [Sphaerisporangium sp. B11E5]|uniref:SWIM zinc finger family protein n=1 Tax=Sphaerisporangium sp. B11E5 TaxID=3153563 RepID=UPI00325DE56F